MQASNVGEGVEVDGPEGGTVSHKMKKGALAIESLQGGGGAEVEGGEGGTTFHKS